MRGQGLNGRYRRRYSGSHFGREDWRKRKDKSETERERERERGREGDRARSRCEGNRRPRAPGRRGDAEREKRPGKMITTRELEPKGGRDSVCPSVRPFIRRSSGRSVGRSAGARISHLHRNKLVGTIGSSVHSEHCKHAATVFPRTNRKPLQYALLTLSTRGEGPIIDPTRYPLYVVQ